MQERAMLETQNLRSESDSCIFNSRKHVASKQAGLGVYHKFSLGKKVWDDS
jgi:hypothetical protein